jgi:hypothetical protein
MLAIFLVLSISTSLGTASVVTISSSNGYSSVDLGTINIILTVPHDGTVKPAGWPDRTDELGNILRDVSTRNFTQVVSDELAMLFLNKTKYAYRPFVVYNNIHRYDIYLYLTLLSNSFFVTLYLCYSKNKNGPESGFEQLLHRRVETIVR